MSLYPGVGGSIRPTKHHGHSRYFPGGDSAPGREGYRQRKEDEHAGYKNGWQRNPSQVNAQTNSVVPCRSVGGCAVVIMPMGADLSGE